jgi:hypothetical protein
MDTATSGRGAHSQDRATRVPQKPSQGVELPPSDTRSHAWSPITLFTIRFKSAMTDADLARLHSGLDLVTYTTPKPAVSGVQPGVVRLDFWSGLFLERGSAENEWVLEGRSWGNPPEPLVHEWHVRAALAAKELDPNVTIPPKAADAAERDLINLQLGRAQGKRLTRLGHRLLRLD